MISNISSYNATIWKQRRAKIARSLFPETSRGARAACFPDPGISRRAQNKCEQALIYPDLIRLPIFRRGCCMAACPRRTPDPASITATPNDDRSSTSARKSLLARVSWGQPLSRSVTYGRDPYRHYRLRQWQATVYYIVFITGTDHAYRKVVGTSSILFTTP